MRTHSPGFKDEVTLQRSAEASGGSPVAVAISGVQPYDAVE